jgi:hypothetical protein
MTPTIQAILARFNYNRTAAVTYCEDMARVYPHLREEYRGLMHDILELGPQPV